MEGLIKIGRTARDPQSRAKELSAATGVPAPFVVAYDAYFKDCAKAEEFVHTRLETKGYRVSNNREFFTAPLKEVINAIMEAQQLSGLELYDEANDESMEDSLISFSTNEPWEDILNQADAHYHGFGNALEDHSTALQLYEKAAKLGSSIACYKVGLMFKAGEGCPKNTETAIKYFTEGANRGDSLCHAEMAKLFSENGHIDNARKCWKRFFDSANLNDIGYQKVARAMEYLRFTKKNKLVIDHRQVLSTFKEDIISAVEDEINKYQDYKDDQTTEFYRAILSEIKGLV